MSTGSRPIISKTIYKIGTCKYPESSVQAANKMQNTKFQYSEAWLVNSKRAGSCGATCLATG